MCRCVPWQGGETCLRCCAGLQHKREALAPYVRKRFVKRIDRPEKNWKFSASDIADRTRGTNYQRIFSDILTHTSTERGPLYLIPLGPQVVLSDHGRGGVR